MKLNGIMNHHERFISLLGYHVSLDSAHDVTKGLNKRSSCLLEYPTNIVSLKYHATHAEVHLPPPLVIGDEEMPLYPLARVLTHPKSQILLLTVIQLVIPKDKF